MATIGIIGDYQPERPSHRATDDALAHSAKALGLDLQTKWIATDALSQNSWEDRVGGFDGFFVAPGSPYKSFEGSLNAIRFAREKKRP